LILRVQKQKAEAAVAGGVFTTSPGDDALVLRSTKGGDGNGLSIMSDWNEFRMSASMESVLKGYADPRISTYFIPSVNTGTYEGLRNGLSVQQLGNSANSAGGQFACRDPVGHLQEQVVMPIIFPVRKM
jgi:hypothetical protein